MKPIKPVLLAVIWIVAVIIWQSCCTSGLKFSGKVIDKSGKGIPEVAIKIGEKDGKTDKNGMFEICVNRSERYVLNASLLGFGHVSKIYTDTSSRVLITMAKATVVTAPPNQDIVVQDLNPDMTSIAPRIASPLDTIPFVYNKKGELIGFTRPKSLSDAQQAIANYQPPVLGARIEIEAGSLVLEGTTNPPGGDVTVSLNTVDIYSPDGMPGDYTVDLGKERDKQIGYMIPFGAANIEAYYNGQRLQLGPNQKATLTIPVDTLAIIAGDELPSEIPLLVYNPQTGFWKVDGSAQLNAEKNAYSTKISHFSTYNMDLFKTTPSCIQICKGLQASSTLSITATNGTKTITRTMPTDAAACAAGRCIVYGPGLETAGIINMPNNTNAELTVSNGGTVATYIINSGDQPTGFPSPTDYQQCNFDACAGPFYITDNKCWEIKDAAAPYNVTGMNAPVMTFAPSGTDLVFTWIFVENTTGGVITNSPNYYEIEYLTFTTGSPIVVSGATTWNKAIISYTTGPMGQADNFPSGAGGIATGSTVWNPSPLTVPFNGGDNEALSASDVWVFRVNVFVNPGEEPGSSATVHPITKGIIAVRNFSTLTASEQTTLTDALDDPAVGPSCYIIVN